MLARPLLISTFFLAACGASDVELDDALDDESVADTELRTNRDAERLVVWSNNIENMIFDWKDLVFAMSEAELRPDIFLVQQITDREEMARLTKFMSRRLGADYTGIVARAHPDDTRFQGQVIPRPTVTTGIVFRTARFKLVNKDSFMPWGRGFRGDVQRCDLRANHSGYETLRLKLFDKVAEKNVVAISLRHWTFHPCSSKNVRELAGDLGNGAALFIVGGDFNDRIFDDDGSYACWYRQMNIDVGEARCASDEDLGFTDPLFVSSRGDRACMRDKGGIDSIFVRRSGGRRAQASHFDIVTFPEAHRASVEATGGDGPSNDPQRDGFRDAGRDYSQHKARRAYVYYDR